MCTVHNVIRASLIPFSVQLPLLGVAQGCTIDKHALYDTMDFFICNSACSSFLETAHIKVRGGNIGYSLNPRNDRLSPTQSALIVVTMIQRFKHAGQRLNPV